MDQSEKDIFIAILKSARERIKSAKETYVCCAIRQVGIENKIYVIFCNRLRAMIEKRIAGCVTVYEWLLTLGIEPPKHVKSKAMRAYRLAWIDDMIRECQEEW